MKKVTIVLILLAIIVAVPVLAQISPHFDLNWSLLSSGGGLRSSAHYQIDDVLGQWSDGLSSSARYQIDPGFWHKGRELRARSIYMPVLLRTRS